MPRNRPDPYEIWYQAGLVGALAFLDPNFIAQASTKSFLGSLALNGIILAASIAAFTYMRRYFRLIYEPRSWSFFDECAFKLSSPSYRGRP